MPMANEAHKDRRRSIGSLVVLVVMAMANCAFGDDHLPGLRDIAPPRTESPLATITSLFHEVERAFEVRAQNDNTSLDALLTQRPIELVDLDHLPRELRDDVGVETILKLYEILRRISLPPLSEIPDKAVVDATGLDFWRVPGTGITLSSSSDEGGPKRFRFTADTIEIADRDYPLIVDLPKQRGDLETDAFVMFRDGVGPNLTRWMGEEDGLVTPTSTRVRIFGVPLWKLVAAIAIHLFALVIMASVYLMIGRNAFGTESSISDSLKRLLLPIVIMFLAGALQFSVDGELRVTGPILEILDVLWVSIFTIGVILLGFAAMQLCAEFFISIAGLQTRPGDRHAVRLVFRVMALLICLGAVVNALQRLGVPVSGIVTGLGVGGIAVALAAQGTLKNLMGGAALLADHPIRIGDFCRFGTQMGTLETIGLRSSRIRSLERTIVTVPNSDLASMHIENFDQRDMFLFKTTVGVRYETSPDQLRAILADIRVLLVAHPSIANDPARARFKSFRDSSLNIEIFAYILADNWDRNLAAREDIMLRIMDVVERNGSAIAFPSRTLYFRRDQEADSTSKEQAEAKIELWRKEGKLPFPDMDASTASELANTLDYPPKGSIERSKP